MLEIHGYRLSNIQRKTVTLRDSDVMFSVWCDSYLDVVIEDQSFWRKHNVRTQECNPFSSGLIDGSGDTPAVNHSRLISKLSQLCPH